MYYCTNLAIATIILIDPSHSLAEFSSVCCVFSKMRLKVIIFFISSISVCSCLNILAVMPHIGKTHFLVYQPLFKKLSSIGHHVTVISFFPQQSTLANFRDVVLKKEKMTGEGILTMGTLGESRWDFYQCPKIIATFGEIGCRTLVSSSNVHEFLHERNKFDVILTEYFNSNCAMGIVRKFDAPVIGLSTCVNPSWINQMFGSSDNPSYMPNVLLDYSDKMTFFGRLENTVFYWFSEFAFKYLMLIPGNELTKKYLQEDILDGGNVMYNASLLLTNTHYTFNRPKPLTPNVIEVAGIHIEEPKALPELFQKYLDDAPNGVIYMSMGTLIQGSSFPDDKRKYFQNVFAELQQRVIWKWENNTMEEKPSNVMITKWAPQREILCHPNVRAFITHGGLLGTLEAVHCGVPMIVIPQFGDQNSNAKAIEASGSGIIMKLEGTTEEIIRDNVNRVLNDEMKQNAKDLSERFRDRPLSPMDTAIYWIEYVAKYKGAKFMRSVATDMPFYQLYLLDVIGFLAVLISLFLYLIYTIVRFLLRNSMSSKTKLKTN